MTIPFETLTAQTLHDEHLNVLALLEKLELALGRLKPGQLPGTGDSGITYLLGDMIAMVETELTAHFKFEEEELFPLLIEAGASDMTGLLSEEHDIILPLALKQCELAGTIRRDGYTTESWNEFRLHALELAERLTGHIEKEERGLLPLLDEWIDAEQDDQLTGNYALMR